MESLTEAGDPIRGAAVLEKGYIDIELNKNLREDEVYEQMECN